MRNMRRRIRFIEGAEMIYLDWAASAVPYTEEIGEAYRTATAVFANPSAQHQFGKDARSMLEDARCRCAAVLGIPAETLYFTSGASESNSLVLLSLLTHPAKGSLVISALEHPSIREQATVLAQCGWKVITVPSDKNGYVSPESVVNAVQGDTVLVAVMGVNNEIGSIQPVRGIAQALQAKAAGKRTIHFHVDMVQSIGKLPVSELGLPYVHSASMSAHKIGGPRGIGLLYLQKTVVSAFRGGAQERGIRPGTENLAGACALARCLEKAYTDFSEIFKRGGELSSFLITKLCELPGCVIIPDERAAEVACSVSKKGQSRQRFYTSFSPWIIQVSFKGVPAEIMMRCLSDRGIFVSAGSACSSKKKIRPILAALSVSPEIAQNAIRVSIGYSTERAELEQFIAAVKEILTDFQ